MTNFKQALLYGLLLVGAVFAAILIISPTIFGDLTNTESFEPLWVIIPSFLILGGYLIYKTNK